uniref:Uncharacterized protein n=1 Tax=Geospiza parvula TaxID=87175 RepID=A0A8C3MTJ2_GEOPR
MQMFYMAQPLDKRVGRGKQSLECRSSSLSQILLLNPSDPGLQPEEIWTILWKRELEVHREQRPEGWGFPCAVMPSIGALRRALAAAVLQFLILSGHWAAAENINFHNIRPPLDPTPFPNSFKCFTCDNAVDNYNCNRWAEDRWCPESTRYCLTAHLFTALGESTSVTKRCATGEECHLVGCHRRGDSGHTECVSCCEGMICNVEIPTNATNAVFAVLQARRAAAGSCALPGLLTLLPLVTLVTLALS